MQQKVLVVGDDGINSLGIIRSLGEVGVKPDAIITSSDNKREPLSQLVLPNYILEERSCVVKWQ